MKRGVLTLSEGEEQTLLAWAAERHGRRGERARVVLLSAAGRSATTVCKELGLTIPTVYKWRKRFAEGGLSGLKDLPRPGQPRRTSDAQKEHIARTTADVLPPQGERWTIRSVAGALGVTEYQVRLVWHERDLVEYAAHAQLVDDPELRARKLTLHGLFIQPPYNAVVLAVARADAVGARGLDAHRQTRSGAALRAVFARAHGAGEPASALDLLTFLATCRAQSDGAELHVVFSSRTVLREIDPAALGGGLGMSTSAKRRVDVWIAAVESFVRASLEDPVSAESVSELAEAVAVYLTHPGRPSHLSWSTVSGARERATSSSAKRSSGTRGNSSISMSPVSEL